MLRRLPMVLAAAFALAAGGFYVLTMPRPVAASDMPAHEADLDNGERMFWAGGCASCHRTPDQDDALLLGGGLPLKTPFGTFHAPNISSHPDRGIGTWSEPDFVNAMMRGLGPGGEHLYPAFPYTSYQRMPVADIRDLFAYLRTLPQSDSAPPGHDLAFPYTIRRGIGLWKLAYLDGVSFAPDAGQSAEWNRGLYLVTGPGHCGECHTPRDAFGGADESRRLAGGPAPEGDGRIPNITQHEDGLADWSENDIAYYFETGFTPDFDSVGGAMAAVQRNLARLPEEDRRAIAVYLKSLPAVEGAPAAAE